MAGKVKSPSDCGTTPFCRTQKNLCCLLRAVRLALSPCAGHAEQAAKIPVEPNCSSGSIGFQHSSRRVVSELFATLAPLQVNSFAIISLS